MKTNNDTRRVEIYDTTLRDGTQTQGVSLSVRDKLDIAEMLDSLGDRGRVDYRARDETASSELTERCRESGDRQLEELAGRVEAEQRRLWEAVASVAELQDSVPFHRHLANGATAAAVAQVLLYQASALDAEPLDHELALLAVDRLQSTLATLDRRVNARVTHGRLKSIIHDLLA